MELRDLHVINVLISSVIREYAFIYILKTLCGCIPFKERFYPFSKSFCIFSYSIFIPFSVYPYYILDQNIRVFFEQRAGPFSKIARKCFIQFIRSKKSKVITGRGDDRPVCKCCFYSRSWACADKVCLLYPRFRVDLCPYDSNEFRSVTDVILSCKDPLV